LLMGNHEAYEIEKFARANFWWNLNNELYQKYADVLSKLPLAVSTKNGIIALHGALPKVKKIEDINNISNGDDNWKRITWGDWNDGDECSEDNFTGRPYFGKSYFEKIMENLGKKVLIRGHQPSLANKPLYDNRCLTIVTSTAYKDEGIKRRIAVVDLSKKVETLDDIFIEDVD
ncbi:MAG: metallophosphoesterase, partial [Candidatus Nanoarchaeia archaeon]